MTVSLLLTLNIFHIFFFADFGQINVSAENATTSDELCSELTQLKPMLRSYKNQSVDLFCRSVDWFLYE